MKLKDIEGLATEDIKVGDAILFGGTPHLVEEITPYEGVLLKGARTAHAANDWRMTLIPGLHLQVLRVAR